ncbi:MAG TPA: hypothetical protein VIV40_09050 [Kofleriaceae bacterium]
MRWSYAIALCCVVAGCQFNHGAAGVDAVDVVAGDAASPDAKPLACILKHTWTADFSIDPTTLNLNGDPEPDWRIREGGTFPGQLADGVWSVARTDAVSLDTQPKTDFNRPMRATARMRNTSSAGTRGVILSLNVDYTPMTFMPLLLEVRLDADEQHQTVTLFSKGPTVEMPIVTFPNLGTGFVDALVDIDPMQNTVTVQVGSESSTHVYTPIPRNMNDDRFATLFDYGSDGQFDEARIEVCQ